MTDEKALDELALQVDDLQRRLAAIERVLGPGPVELVVDGRAIGRVMLGTWTIRRWRDAV